MESNTNNLAQQPPPLVSVCVQTYQHVKFISKCLDGILMQKTDFPFEVILGEDESKDGTREICIKYAEKYPDKIRLFLRSRKDVIYIGGRATGRYNFLENLKASKGKYIALCEGDDYWTDENKLQKQVEFLEGDPEFVMCFHKVEIQDGENILDDFITKVPEGLTTITISDLIKGNFIHTPTVMFRNNVIVFPDWFVLSPVGDYPLYILLALKGKIKYLEYQMAVYRCNIGIWGTLDRTIMYLNWLKTLMVLKFDIPKEFIRDFYEYQENNLLVTIERQYIQCKEVINTKEYRLGAFILKPFKILKKIFRSLVKAA